VLAPGDSGAWVVDSASNQLHGHVVASDVFGVSYIVPAPDVFKDIQRRLSLQAIKLPASTAPIFEARVPRTNGLSQEQVSKTLSDALKAVGFHQNFSGESGIGHQSSSEGGLPAKAETQSIARHKNLPNLPSHGPFLDSSNVNMRVSEFDEPQQHRADSKSEMRYMKPVMENHHSASSSPIVVPEAAQIASPRYPPTQTFIEPDHSLQRQRIPRKPVAVHEASASNPSTIDSTPEPFTPFKHDASDASIFDYDEVVRRLNTGGWVFASEITEVKAPRAPVVVPGPYFASRAIKTKWPKSKDNILVRAFHRLRRRQKTPEATHTAILPSSKVTIISSADMNSKYYPTGPLSNLQPPPAPMEPFRDSGYSTMANTPEEEPIKISE